MFELITDKKPSGDQPNSIKELVSNFNKGIKRQVLLGATGTGKTFTMANVIQKLNKKTLVLAPNKTLAIQLYTELKDLFPNNKVEYFVSYFDFYQPEAYVVKSGTYIEKSSKANQQIEMMRISTYNSLAQEDDVIVVASVAAIYASCSPEEFVNNYLRISIKENPISLSELKKKLVIMNYDRNDSALTNGSFRVKGDIVEIAPSYTDEFVFRISYFGEDIEDISIINPVTKMKLRKVDEVILPVAKEYVSNNETMIKSTKLIEEELEERIQFFKKNNQLIEAQRIKERTEHDIEQLLELGYCSGIENYSRHLEFREEGQTPFTLFDYFNKQKDWLLIMDECHLMIPQIHGMYNTDRSRKTNLVDYGFRLPSALDNRPLMFEEFYEKTDKIVFVSATPNEWEIEESNNHVVEQIVRPTGLLDPIVKVESTKNQIIRILELIKENNTRNERTLITTLTIRMAEELSNYLIDNGIKAYYLHNEIKTIERTTILNKLRKGIYDVVIGINLLREGIDLPEVSTVMILDADKEGFLRNEKSLIQIIGRASRNASGKVYMFADEVTKSMKAAIDETERRRKIQEEYNKKNKITPKTIIKAIPEDLSLADANIKESNFKKKYTDKFSPQTLAKLKKEMEQAAKNQEYERAAYLRDIIIEHSND